MTATKKNGKPRARVVSGRLVLASRAPKHCAANRDGECSHKGCPQLIDWQPICPIGSHEDDR
jgi:hypothetical protein